MADNEPNIREGFNAKIEPLTTGEHSLTEIFSKVKGPLKKDHKYFIDGHIALSPLSNGELAEFHSIEPFFIHKRDSNQVLTNKNVIPYVWDDKLGSRDIRFKNAEALTSGDSGLLALCAVSAENPSEQENLYKTLAVEIINIHRADPELIGQWTQAQTVKGAESDASSLDVLVTYDLRRFEQTRDEDELLALPTLKDGGEVDLDKTRALWRQRLYVLSEAIGNDSLSLNHLRWLEHLSHSVDIEKLMAKIKEQSEGQSIGRGVRNLEELRDKIEEGRSVSGEHDDIGNVVTEKHETVGVKQDKPKIETPGEYLGLIRAGKVKSRNPSMDWGQTVRVMGLEPMSPEIRKVFPSLQFMPTLDSYDGSSPLKKISHFAQRNRLTAIASGVNKTVREWRISNLRTYSTKEQFEKAARNVEMSAWNSFAKRL